MFAPGNHQLRRPCGSAEQPLPVFPTGAPPAWIPHACDDATVPSEYSARLYEALKLAKIPAELQIYAGGGHGLGIIKGLPVDQWPDRLKEWLQQQGWLTARR
jgi:acetyl esterase/lipase